MQTVTTIGLDIAKSVFQVHGVDAADQVLIRRQLKRRRTRCFLVSRLLLQGRQRHGRPSSGRSGASGLLRSRRHVSHGDDLPHRDVLWLEALWAFTSLRRGRTA